MSKITSRLSFITPTPIQPELPLFIFLPGMDGTGQLYQRQADRLAKFFDIRCLAIPPDDMNDWDGLAKKTVALIKNELLNRQRDRDGKSSYASPHPVYLCGESFGGCLALKLVLEAPKLFDRLILVNPSSSFNRRPCLSWGIQITHSMPDFLHPVSALALLPFLASLERMSSGDRMALLRAMNSIPPHVVSWRLSLLKNFAVAENDLRRIAQPTLLIASTGDRVLPSVEEAKRLDSFLPNTQTVILPDSGHACLLETNIYLDEILKANNFIASKLLSRDRQVVA
ncbi:alpha/beta hydrolase [Hydrococcus rivularis NIES-593]|uniref:Alpha/beta hydrolase n=1 Tax=Hydrococcus rivularis NIES-593 TaxID=1921803 RepID=A0A1U7HH18_9CYAN|nr:alpha/beta hydrolase [Hydrococcus rivularis]OKH22828.1 alpha/beta hydrolase [Hydrococcus rivularis NIES-593]